MPLQPKIYTKEDFDSLDEVIERLNWHSEMHYKLANKLTALDMNFFFTEFLPNKNPAIPPEIYSAVLESALHEKH